MNGFGDISFYLLTFIPGGLGSLFWVVTAFMNPKDKRFSTALFEAYKQSAEVVATLIIHVGICMALYDEVFTTAWNSVRPGWLESWEMNLNPFTAFSSGILSHVVAFRLIPIFQTWLVRRAERRAAEDNEKEGGK